MPTPTTLTYETPALADPLWPAIRVGTGVYAAGVLVRHAIYWSMLAQSHGVASVLAAAESALLVGMLTLAVVTRRLRPSAVRWLGALAFGVIAISLCTFANEVLNSGWPRDRTGMARLAWSGVARVPQMAIPAVLIVAWLRPRRTA